MNPFNWKWWRLAWSRRNRGGAITFGTATRGARQERWEYVAFGLWFRVWRTP